MPKSLAAVSFLLFLFAIQAAAQPVTALAPGISLTPEARLAAFSYGGAGEESLALAANGSDFAALTLRRTLDHATIIYTRLDANGHPDLTSRRPIDVAAAVASTSNGRALIFWSRSGQTYASRIASDGQFVTQVPVMAGAPERSVCGDVACVVIASDGTTAVMTDAEGQPVTTSISLKSVLQYPFVISSLAVDEHGFAFITTPGGGAIYGQRAIRFDVSGRQTFDVPVPPTIAAIVWSGNRYRLFSYLFDHGSRIVVETEVTATGEVTATRGIATEPNGETTFTLLAARYGDGSLLVIGNPPHAVEVYVLNRQGDVVSKRNMAEPAILQRFAPIASNGVVALALYWKTFDSSSGTPGVVVVGELAPLAVPGELVSYGALDQRLLAAAGVRSGSVVVWGELDAEIVHLRAARVSSSGNGIDAAPLALRDSSIVALAELFYYTYPTSLRSASAGDDVLFVWRELFQYTVPGTLHSRLSGAVVHFMTGAVEAVAPTLPDDFGGGGGVAHYDVVSSPDGYLIIGNTADGVEVATLSKAGVLTRGPQVIARGEQLQSAASDGQDVLVVTSAHVIVLAANGEVTATLPPPFSMPQGPAGQHLTFGSTSFLLSSNGSNRVTRVTRAGYVGSSAVIPAFVDVSSQIVPVRDGWMIFTSRGVATRIADTDPPTLVGSSFVVPVPVPFAVAAEDPGRVLIAYPRPTAASPSAANALYTSRIVLTTPNRRRAVVK